MRYSANIFRSYKRTSKDQMEYVSNVNQIVQEISVAL